MTDLLVRVDRDGHSSLSSRFRSDSKYSYFGVRYRAHYREKGKHSGKCEQKKNSADSPVYTVTYFCDKTHLKEVEAKNC